MYWRWKSVAMKNIRYGTVESAQICNWYWRWLYFIVYGTFSPKFQARKLIESRKQRMFLEKSFLSFKKCHNEIQPPPPTAAALWWCDALVTLLLSVDELGGGFLILEMRRMEVEECEVYLMFQRNWQQLPWHFAQMKWIPYDDRRVNSLGWKQVSRLLPRRHRRSHVQRYSLLHMVF